MNWAEYLQRWGHLYVIHFGAWVSFCFGTTVYKNGLPPPPELKGLFKSALLLAAILSIFSSHTHYMSQLASNVQEIVKSKN